jgi:formylglycine-generating enzyme required for sulfatase activity
MATLKQLLQRTHQNLLILKEREAKHGGNAPLELLNQISDHEAAVTLIKQALSTELTETGLKTLKEELRPMLVAGNVEQLDLDEVKLDRALLPYEPETVLIPAGSFLMGSDSREVHEAPQHTVELAEYRLGKFPVTNKQFAEFIRQTGRIAGAALVWDGNLPPGDKLDHPVTGVTWFEVLAYCRWLSEQTGQNYSLPSEAQWEKAARGTDARLYPWGPSWLEGRCNQAEQIVAVTTYPAQNEYGCYDLVGNAREWTSTLWGSSRNVPDPAYSYPWLANDGRDDLTAPGHVRRVYRSGPANNVAGLRCSRRGGFLPDKPGPRRSRHGFRVVLLSP